MKTNKNKIKASDLKVSQYLFLFIPGSWSHGGLGDGVTYKHPCISVCRTVEGSRDYATQIFVLKGQTHKGPGEAERPSYAWDLDVRIENMQSPVFARFVSAMKNQTRFCRDIRWIMRALKTAKIPRYVEDRIPGKSTRYTPRKYKGRENDFHNAFELVEQA